MLTGRGPPESEEQKQKWGQLAGHRVTEGTPGAPLLRPSGHHTRAASCSLPGNSPKQSLPCKEKMPREERIKAEETRQRIEKEDTKVGQNQRRGDPSVPPSWEHPLLLPTHSQGQPAAPSCSNQRV